MGLFSRIFTRSKDESVVNPCPIPDNDNPVAKALVDVYNGNKIDAMNLSTFFAAVNIFSNSIAMMDWKFLDEEGNSLRKSHYLYHLFDDSLLTRFNTVKNVIQDMILFGNGFIFIERNRDTGAPQTLHYSPACDTIIFYNAVTHKVSYQNPFYSKYMNDGTDYLHFFINSDNGYIGKGILQYAYNVIDIASTIQKSTETYYGTTGNMFGIVSPAGELPNIGNKKNQLEKLEATWNEARRKINKGCVFFPSDLKFTPLSASAKDTSLIESREYNVVEIGRFVQNISPVLLGDLRHNSYGTLAESQREFIIHSLAPTVKMWEEQCNKKLIMPSKWHTQFVDLDEYSILATDQEKQANYLSTLANNGIISANEARYILHLPPVEGADNLIIPFTKVEDNTVNDTVNKNNNDIEQ